MSAISVGMDDAAYEAFRDQIFARMWSDVAPFAEEIEETETIPREKIWPALADMGAFGLLVPAEYGGSELSVRQYLPIIAELSKVHGGVRAAVHVHNSIGHALYELGNDRRTVTATPASRLQRARAPLPSVRALSSNTCRRIARQIDIGYENGSPTVGE